VNLEDPNFEWTPYEPFVAYGRSKTANILFAVAFDKRHRDHGVRAAAVHPGGIQTELDRHVDPSLIRKSIEQMNQQLAAEGKAPFQLKTILGNVRNRSIWADSNASCRTAAIRTFIVPDARPRSSKENR
jgi:NAD(P)-dependent dehydrogenase (short-subunit alcohol dehydrogenase family)